MQSRVLIVYTEEHNGYEEHTFSVVYVANYY